MNIIGGIYCPDYVPPRSYRISGADLVFHAVENETPEKYVINLSTEQINAIFKALELRIIKYEGDDVLSMIQLSDEALRERE